MDRDLNFVRWITFCALVAVSGIFLLPELQRGDRIFLPTLLLVIVAALFLTWALELWLRLIVQRMTNPPPKVQTSDVFDIQFVFELNRKFLQAASAQDILEITMSALCDVANAIGCSFVPYDEWGQGLPALVRGKMPSSALQHWAERLSAPGTRQACKSCKVLEAHGDCILLPDKEHASESVRCITLKRAEREIGVFNLYFESSHTALDHQQRTLFEQIVVSASIGLQALQMREIELVALRQMQTSSSQRAALTELLNGLLANLQKTLEVDFASFWIPSGIISESHRALFLSTHARDERAPGLSLSEAAFVQGLWESISKARQPVLLSNVSLHEKEMWRSLSAFPVMWNEDQPLGVLFAGSQRVFSQEQLALLRTIAGEAALIVLNARFMVEVEYQAVLDERARLAREIHDGLAQTLAFLKMQSDQMQMVLAQGKTDQLTDMLKASSRTLNDAYLDARQAIDNLRRVPDVELDDLLRRMAEEFMATTHIPVDISAVTALRGISLNLRAQLIRIVQESLSNVRKHARAKSVIMVAREKEGELFLEVRDDGIGFVSEMVASPAQYGLRGMRERAEMIGADFQVISRSGEGTTVRLQIPVAIEEGK